jgi:hypothetical protein
MRFDARHEKRPIASEQQPIKIASAVGSRQTISFSSTARIAFAAVRDFLIEDVPFPERVRAPREEPTMMTVEHRERAKPVVL